MNSIKVGADKTAQMLNELEIIKEARDREFEAIKKLIAPTPAVCA